MKNFRGSALAAGVGTPESAPHELLGSSLHFYLRFKHRNFFIVSRCEDNQNYCKNNKKIDRDAACQRKLAGIPGNSHIFVETVPMFETQIKME